MSYSAKALKKTHLKMLMFHELSYTSLALSTVHFVSFCSNSLQRGCRGRKFGLHLSSRQCKFFETEILYLFDTVTIREDFILFLALQ